MCLNYLYLAVLASFFIQILFWRLIFVKSRPNKPIKAAVACPPVSILICSHNEFPQLRQNIPLFLEQDYPAFELILIDDGSDDETEIFFSKTYTGNPKFIFKRIEKKKQGKKPALLTAVSLAQHPWLALTDADCTPKGKYWLKSMMQSAHHDSDLILGYAPYKKRSGILNAFIRYETCMNAIQMFSAAAMQLPYAAVGRNMAYKRSLLTESALQIKIPYGDDDLLVQHHSENIIVSSCLDPEGFIYTTAKQTYLDYFRQKMRHYATSKTYNFKSISYLSLYFGSLIIFYVGIVLLTCHGNWIEAISFYMLKHMICWPVFHRQTKIFDEKDVSKYYPLLELFYVCHISFQLPFLFFKRKHW
ncbi:MAG: glycosyltransferase [Saprospiraceae bacterium]|nr:glycosyltransferase [Saprospiraceae bacterium]